MYSSEIEASFSPGSRGYLDTPSMGLPARATIDAMQHSLERWYGADAHYSEWERTAEECRASFARRRSVVPSHVGLVPGVTAPLAAVAHTLARRGGLVLAHRDEFRSLLLPFFAAFGEDRVRWVDGDYSSASFGAKLDDAVAAVVVSSVSSSTGARVDLGALADATAAVGAELIVDSTQSEGILPLGVEYARVSAVACAGYKGLLGPRGSGYIVLDPARGLASGITANPYGMSDNARRGSYGGPLLAHPGGRGLEQSPAWFSWVGALPGLTLLEGVPIAGLEEYVLALTTGLRRGLEASGIAPQQTELDSNIVSIPVADPDAVLAALSAAGIRAAVRLGRLRLGVHLYTSHSDIDTTLTVLTSLSGKHYERTQT
jgi:selenocysteine lyase/cysteine desulfurase